MQNVLGQNVEQAPPQAQQGQPLATLYVQDKRYNDFGFMIIMVKQPITQATTLLTEIGAQYWVKPDNTEGRLWLFNQESLALLFDTFIPKGYRITSCRFIPHPVEGNDPIIMPLQGDLQSVEHWVSTPSYRLPDHAQTMLEQIANTNGELQLQTLVRLIEAAHAELPAPQ